MAVIVAAMLVVILGVCGLAIDLGSMYNRRVEVQHLPPLSRLLPQMSWTVLPPASRALARFAAALQAKH